MYNLFRRISAESEHKKGANDMAGGSHTRFDQAAFTVGAIGGAATIAGAVGVGIRNFQAQRRERRVRDVVRRRDALIRRLRYRVQNQDRVIDAFIDHSSNMGLEIEELRLRLAMANYLRRQS
jgi:hypothetical protein